MPRAEKAIKDDQGNPIATTYATKDELEDNYATKEDVKNASPPIATIFNPGLVQVGDNIAINEDGIISVNKENVVNALGYTPVDNDNIRAMTEAEIDAMFAGNEDL